MNNKRSEWIEEYSCGCSSTAPTKKQLLGYCNKHGASRKNVIRLRRGAK